MSIQSCYLCVPEARDQGSESPLQKFLPIWKIVLDIHCRPDITRMSGSTTSDHVISESRYTEVFYYVTNGIQI